MICVLTALFMRVINPVSDISCGTTMPDADTTLPDAVWMRDAVYNMVVLLKGFDEFGFHRDVRAVQMDCEAFACERGFMLEVAYA